MGIIVSLLNQGVDEKLINDAIKFKEFYKIDENLKHRLYQLY